MAGKLSKINLNDYKPLREVIFNSLREAIIIGELRPGERLMEVQLAEKMGVSRTPVREAIRKLELEGLVDMIPRKGAHVAELSVKDIMDVLEVRASLDGLATALAAERITDDEMKELKHINIQFSQYIEKENLNGSIKKDAEFHDIIYKASRNDKLISILNNLRGAGSKIQSNISEGLQQPKNLIKEHSDIYEAIAARSIEASRSIAKTHIQNQEATILNSIKMQKK